MRAQRDCIILSETIGHIQSSVFVCLCVRACMRLLVCVFMLAYLCVFAYVCVCVCQLMCLCVMYESSHLCVSQSLIVDFIQDDHAVGGIRLKPLNMNCVLSHVIADGPHYVICFVCRQDTQGFKMASLLSYYYKHPWSRNTVQR
jgi:hypothetical protein